MNRPMEKERDAGGLRAVLHRALALAEPCDAVAAAHVAMAIARLEASVARSGGDPYGADDH